MYLCDQVAQSRRETLVEDGGGRVHSVPGPADLAADVRACSTRYVLDATVRDTCLELLCNRAEVIRLEDRCYRIPHEALWIEWTDPAGAGKRAGVMVLADDETGRRGIMHSFSQDAASRPWAAQIVFAFDFDNELSDQRALCGLGFGEVRDPQAVERMFRHGMGRIDHRWLAYFRASGGLPPDALQQMLRSVAPDFGMLCAFLLLLSLECAVAQPRAGLDKINRARARTGKSLLLDHVEVSLRLAAVGEHGFGVGSSRSAARLHQVRGHLVRRAGKTFWRNYHLRGDAAMGVIASRTVRVSGNGAALRAGLG
ncbi:hypothetical protein OF829_06850 [Sphingomonas sp. LB-2]|uniref:hypothetical protein n=1 Tax=Sphingomonas caeni TaxID=2984949 RepID=UPI00222EEE20|nr:hypothetical protein [Sphingomonas caeni]MCW3846953.1 hypothetical protein [Sphingomonas caeni]